MLFFQLCDVFTSRGAIKHFEDSRQFTEFGLLLKKWSMLREIIHILAVPYKATIEMQRHDLSLSDAFGSWLKMELHLQNKQRRVTRTGLETKLLVALSERKRRHRIFGNSLMKAALYLDPRFRRQITTSQVDTNEAKQTLLTIAHRLSVLSEERLTDNMNQSNGSRNSSDDSFDAQKEFDRYFNRTAPVNSDIQSDFEATLDLFDPTPMKIDSSVWNTGTPHMIKQSRNCYLMLQWQFWPFHQLKCKSKEIFHV